MPNDPSEIVGAHRPGGLRKWARTYLLERTLWRIPRTRDVLDLCCGYGFYFGINPHAVGFDGDPRAVEALRRQGRTVDQGDLLAGLPYGQDSFGWVVAHDVLEHFTRDELERVFSEVHRVLRPGGRFVVLVPNRRGYEYGVRIEIGHKLFVTAREVNELARGRFEVEAEYPEPLPRVVGRFFTHNKEVFRLRKLG